MSIGLALETSGALGSVALGSGDRVLGMQVLSAPLRHAVEFVSAVADLCGSHGVRADAIQSVYVSVGPGSFTGLRIGIATARTLAFATGARVVAVPTLEVIAQNALEAAPPPPWVAAMLDAKRRNAFAAVYRLDRDRYVPASEPAEVEPDRFLRALIAAGHSPWVLGDGVSIHRVTIEQAGARTLPPELHRARAETVYRLGREQAATGRFTPRQELIPHYVRPPEAEEKWKRKAAAEATP